MNFLKSLGLAALLSVAFVACEDDPCKDVTCQNSGTCVEGVCNCTAGYEGTLCETLSRERLLGTGGIPAAYNVQETCNGTPATYAMTISAAAAVDGILLQGFWGLFIAPVQATVSGTNITIANQIPDNDGYSVSGTGTYNTGSNTINFSFTVTDNNTVPATSQTCTATATKL